MLINDSIEQIIQDYNSVVKVIEGDALAQNNRSYVGMIRSVKGRLQEHITERIVKIAWRNLKGDPNSLTINSDKIKLPIRDDYINKIKNQNVKEYIIRNKNDYCYKLSVDKHIFINKKFVIGIECKAYTENAMLKRVLIDFHLLKTIYPNISCYLFQLESQLGGDYSDLSKQITYGSKSSHSIMSYFENVELNIFTFLNGERNINKPIHKFFKPLEKNVVDIAIKIIQNDLRQYL